MPYRTVWNPDPLSISFRPGLRSGAASAIVAIPLASLSVYMASQFEFSSWHLLDQHTASAFVVWLLLLVGVPTLLTLVALFAALERLWACETLAIEPAHDLLKSTRRLLFRRPEPRVFAFRDMVDFGVEARPFGWSRVVLVGRTGSRVKVAEIPEGAQLLATHLAPLRGRLHDALESMGRC